MTTSLEKEKYPIFALPRNPCNLSRTPYIQNPFLPDIHAVYRVPSSLSDPPLLTYSPRPLHYLSKPYITYLQPSASSLLHTLLEDGKLLRTSVLLHRLVRVQHALAVGSTFLGTLATGLHQPLGRTHFQWRRQHGTLPRLDRWRLVAHRGCMGGLNAGRVWLQNRVTE